MYCVLCILSIVSINFTCASQRCKLLPLLEVLWLALTEHLEGSSVIKSSQCNGVLVSSHQPATLLTTSYKKLVTTGEWLCCAAWA